MAATYTFPSQNWYSGFSLRKLYVAPIAGTLNTGASSTASISTWYRIPGSLAINGTMGAKSVDQYGDDGLVNIWLYDARMSLDLETSMSTPQFYSIITGNTATQLGASTANDQAGAEVIYFGSDLEHTPPHVMIRAESTCRVEGPNNATSASQYVRFTWFNCQITNIVGPEALAYGQVHTNRFRLEAIPGYFDEFGNNLTNVAGPGAISAIAKAEWGFEPILDGSL